MNAEQSEEFLARLNEVWDLLAKRAEDKSVITFPPRATNAEDVARGFVLRVLALSTLTEYASDQPIVLNSSVCVMPTATLIQLITACTVLGSCADSLIDDDVVEHVDELIGLSDPEETLNEMLAVLAAHWTRKIGLE
ncbi:hypothetical protein D6833_11010 [Candidatus Parcubacteria bacterium]|nr:MAG: hypothetical protein D6833_11010 [Candidatus Parcubacteria bacterium]